MNQWERLESSVLDTMKSLHQKLLDMTGDSPDFYPKVYMHPLLKEGLLFGDHVQLNGKELPIETDKNMIMGEIYIMDKTLNEA